VRSSTLLVSIRQRFPMREMILEFSPPRPTAASDLAGPVLPRARARARAESPINASLQGICPAFSVRDRDKSNYISPLAANGQWPRIMNILRRHRRRLIATNSVSLHREMSARHIYAADSDNLTGNRICPRAFVIARFTRRHGHASVFCISSPRLSSLFIFPLRREILRAR